MQDDWRSAFRLSVRLVTAHHPLCGHFRSDRWMLGAVPLCRGCVLMWPAAAVGLATGALALGMLGVNPVALGAAAFIAGLPQASTYLRRWPDGMRAAAKVVGGLGLGILAAAIASLPAPLTVRLAGFAVLLLGAALGLVLRMLSMLGICRRCPWRMDWERCPGFEGRVTRARPGLDEDAQVPWQAVSAQ